MQLPEGFIQRMQNSLGLETFALFEESLQEDAPVSVRVNEKKLNTPLMLEKINWCSSGYFLEDRPSFVSDPLWHAGAYYVQEASSMLLEQVFIAAKKQFSAAVKILDLCAAPGGKSTHLASLCDDHDVLVCNEIIRSRVPVLAENLRKQGYANTIITSADSSDFSKKVGVFDIILVDAPCSGEGLFRKDPEAVKEWTIENVNTCELRQKRILENVVKCLKPGGVLIYSTCTYNTGENEKQIEQLHQLGFKSLPFSVNGQEYTTYQCYPHFFRGEGFYIAALIKPDGDNNELLYENNHSIKLIKPEPEWISCIKDPLPIYGFEDRLIAAPEETFEFFLHYLSGIYCYSIGAELGHIKDKRFNPSAFLPFSLILSPEKFPVIELDVEKSLSYLSKNAIPYNGTEKGYVLLKHNTVMIGLGKLAGNRVNNLFPSEWRLRKIPAKDQWFSICGHP